MIQKLSRSILLIHFRLSYIIVLFFAISCQNEDDTTLIFPKTYQFSSEGGCYVLKQKGNKEMSLYIDNTLNPGVDFITENDLEYGGEHTKSYPYIRTEWLKIKKLSNEEIELTAVANNTGKNRSFRFSVMGHYEEDQMDITIGQSE